MKLEWFPLYIQKIKGSSKYKLMKDYQQAWYWNLLLECADSERPGYLPLDGQLWRLANAHTEQFFNREKAAVLACFKRIEADGQMWIYNERMLVVIREQTEKLTLKTKGKSGGGVPPEVPSLSSSHEVSIKDLEEIDTLIETLFQFYVVLFKRDSRYKLTPERRKKCRMRLVEYMVDNKTGLGEAVEAAKEAMKRLSKSGFHMSKGFYDWNEQFFRSQEEFQKRLDAKYEQGQKKNLEVIRNAFA